MAFILQNHFFSPFSRDFLVCTILHDLCAFFVTKYVHKFSRFIQFWWFLHLVHWYFLTYLKLRLWDFIKPYASVVYKWRWQKLCSLCFISATAGRELERCIALNVNKLAEWKGMAFQALLQIRDNELSTACTWSYKILLQANSHPTRGNLWISLHRIKNAH